MKKGVRITLWVLAGIIGFAVLILAGAQVFVNSRHSRGIVDGFAGKYVDGSLNYTRLHLDLFRSFPYLGVEMDSVSLTYPRSRWAAYDSVETGSPLLESGRGETEDTLASFSHFYVSVNARALARDEISLGGAHLEGMRLYAHAYSDSAANWKMFILPEKKEKEKKSFPFSVIKTGRIVLDGHPTAVYTSLDDTLHAFLRFKQLRLKGELGMPAVEIRGAQLGIDSLALGGRVRKDTMGLFISGFSAGMPRKNTVDVQAAAEALLVSGRLGSMNVPFGLDLSASVERKDSVTRIDFPKLRLDAAYIPLEAQGFVRFRKDSNYVKATVKTEDCRLGEVLDKYASGMLKAARDVRTDAVMDLEAQVDGYFSGGSLPSVEAALSLSESAVEYLPMDIKGRLSMEATASLAGGQLSAVVKSMRAAIPGASVALNGRASGLLGGDPSFSARVTGNAVAEELRRFLPDNILPSGNLDLEVDADTRLSELKAFKFKKGAVSGRIKSSSLSLRMPPDSIAIGLERPDIRLSANPSGMHADLLSDTVSFSKGALMNARARNMVTSADLSKTASGIARASLTSDNTRVFFRSGENRIGARELSLSASLGKRIRRDNARRRHFLDSLQLVYPDIPRDSLLRHERLLHPRAVPDFMQDKAFASKDIRLNLNEKAVKFLQEWSPSATVTASGGFYATPRLPLRNRLGALDVKYDDDEFDIRSLKVTSGTSDASLSGKVTGLRRTLQGRGFLRGDLAVDCGYLNLNELLSALELGRKADTSYVAGSESDESFVTDTLAGAMYVPGEMKVFVVPANLEAELVLHAGKVDYIDYTATSADLRLRAARRCLQLTDASLVTNMGKIGLDAFYASRSRSDIQLGADLKLSEVSAYDIIHMFPDVDRMMPALKSFNGNLNCRITATTQLDTMMNVLVPTLDGTIHIGGEDLFISDAGKLRAVTTLLFFKDKNIGHIDNMDVDAVVSDSQAEVYPFIIGVDKYRLALMGVQGFDGSMRYNISVVRAPMLPLKFGVNLFGNVKDFNYSIGRSKYPGSNVPVFTQEIDDLRINIHDAIVGVYQQGVEGALEATRRSYAALEARKKELGYTSDLPGGLLSNQEYQQLEVAAFEAEMDEYNAEVDAEIDAALEESLKK